MSTRSSDFNYKVALASGLKSLQAGRLRQAEEQFRYLLTRFPAADGGYRGLAKVLIEEEDRPSALRMLLDGGAAIAKAGQRTSAIGLYRDAAALDPSDLTAHRRLAAALMLAGDPGASAAEYVRYIEAALLVGAKERARLEAEFALERHPDSRELLRVARKLGMDVPEPPPEPATAPAPAPAASRPAAAMGTKSKAVEQDRAEIMRSAFGGASPRQESPPPRHDSVPPRQESVSPRQESAPPSQPSWRDAAASAPPAPETAASEAAPIERTSSWSDPWSSDSSDPQAVTLGGSDGEQPADDADSQAVEANAARYLAKKDPRGGDAALEAARRYIAAGRNDAASDLLLQLISSGVADHDAQRLLVDVVRTLGKRDVAKAKCKLLVQALRLDGREDLAAEVEQLALGD